VTCRRGADLTTQPTMRAVAVPCQTAAASFAVAAEAA
jgi:hypothetical protein